MINWNLVAADDCTVADPREVWGGFDAASPWQDRHVLHPDGGPDGGPWRELTVFPGDTLGFSGIRAELGPNDRAVTFALFPEGARMRVLLWLRLGADFGIDANLWGGVLQLKQCQPYANPCGNVPMVDLGGYGGSLRFTTADPRAATLTDRKLWTPPAPGAWVKVRVDGHFSQGPDAWTRMRVGKLASERIAGPNLLRACADYNGWPGGPPSILAGESIPGHLRVGPYTHPDRGQQSIGIAGVEVWRRG